MLSHLVGALNECLLLGTLVCKMADPGPTKSFLWLSTMYTASISCHVCTKNFLNQKEQRKGEPVLTKNFLQPSTTATMLVVLNIHTELLYAIIIELEVKI